jgi:hypothetical protein
MAGAGCKLFYMVDNPGPVCCNYKENYYIRTKELVMSDLQTAYYIIGIVFMSLMLLAALVGVVTLLVIRAKIVAIHRHIEDRIAAVSDWAGKGEAVLGAIKKVAHSPKK